MRRAAIFLAAAALCAMSPREKIAIRSAGQQFPAPPTVGLRSISGAGIFYSNATAPAIGSNPFSVQAQIKVGNALPTNPLVITCAYNYQNQTSSNSQFVLYETTTGALELQYFTSDNHQIGGPSTQLLPPMATNQAIWVRADVFPAVAQINYYVSYNGKFWFPLGTPITSTPYSGVVASPTGTAFEILNYSGTALNQYTYQGSIYEVKVSIAGNLFDDVQIYTATPGSTVFTDRFGYVWHVYNGSGSGIKIQ